MKSYLTPAIVLLFTFVIACNNQKSSKNEETTGKDTTIKETTETDKPIKETTGTDTFIYEYVDASVPPQYHRSYTIKVVPAMVYLTVTDYSKTLLSESIEITPATYTDFVKKIAGLNITNKEQEDSKGCTGGKTDKLDLYSGNPLAVKGSVYHCGGSDFGNLRGDVNAAAQLFRNLIPGLQGKIDKTVENSPNVN